MLRLLILLIAALSAFAQTDNSPAALDAHGDFTAAEAAWKQAIAAAPNDAQLWMGLGVTLSHQERYREAEDAYQKALALKPRDPRIELDLGIAYFKSAQLPAALSHLRVAAAGMPSSGQAQLLLGMTLYGTGAFKDAIPHLEKADAQNNPALQQVLAECFLQAGQYQQALAEFKQMLQHDPNSPAVHMLLGQAYDALNQPDKAITEFQAAAAYDLPDVHFGLGYLYWQQRRYGEAAAEFRKELASDPKNAKALAYLGDISMKNGDAAKAQDLLQQSLKLRNDIRVAQLDLGIIEENKKDYAAATKDLQCAVALDPSAPDAHYNLARVYAATGQKALAEQQLAAVKQLHEKTRQDLLLKVSGPPPDSSAGR